MLHKYLLMTYYLRVFLANLSPATIRLGQASATRALGDRFGCVVLLKGVHLAGDLVNLLWDGHSLHKWESIRLEDVNTHGSGCMLSAVITAKLAAGESLRESVFAGLKTVHQALANPILLQPKVRLAGIEP